MTSDRARLWRRRTFGLLATVLPAFAGAGRHTAAGFGKDVSEAGDAIPKETR